MSRKVFLSVLGSSQYGECIYIENSTGYKSKPVRYIQEAIIEKTARSWSDEDELIILLTEGEKGSRAKNWNDSPTGMQGLASRIAQLDIEPKVTACDIPDGNTTDEIWLIFEKIFDNLKENDRLYIDITHGFRYLPMLVIVLGNYAKFLKNITVESITYGNWEGRNKDTNEAPIIELAPFSLLQDWTNAVNEFTKNGSSYQISELLNNEIAIIKGGEKQALQKFLKDLNAFTGAISTVRGEEIYKGNLVKNIIASSKLIRKKTSIKALKPIIEKLENKIDKFSDEYSLSNAEIAIQWCLDHNLIQQAYTLGQEHIISLLCIRFGLKNRNKTHRAIITSTIGYIIEKRKNPEKPLYDLLNRHKEDFEVICSDPLVNEISSNFSNLSGKRNTLNHAGMIGDVSSKEIIEQFERDYQPIIEKITNL